jgi:hypothetical protein
MLSRRLAIAINANGQICPPLPGILQKLQFGLEKVVIEEASSAPEARDFMDSHIILVANLNLGSAEPYNGDA